MHTIIYIIFLVMFSFCSESIGADLNAGGDIILKSNKGDLLSAPTKKGELKVKTIKGKTTAQENMSMVINEHMAKVSEMLQKKDNVLDVYIGQCRFVPRAMKEVKAFTASHKNITARFYNLKTDDSTDLSQTDIGGLEILPATQAKQYEVNTVPAYVFHVNGKAFKVTGDASIEDIYQDILRNKIEGEKKGSYFNAGAKGSECPAYIPEYGISTLSEQQKEMFARKLVPPASMNVPLPNLIDAPEFDNPQAVTKQIASSKYTTFKKYIVFSVNQKDWARKMISDKATIGCCTNCEISSISREFGPYVQSCTQDMLNALGVSGVPTVVYFK